MPYLPDDSVPSFCEWFIRVNHNMVHCIKETREAVKRPHHHRAAPPGQQRLPLLQSERFQRHLAAFRSGRLLWLLGSKLWQCDECGEE